MSSCLIFQRPRHLLDDELGVHPHLDVGARVDRPGRPPARRSARQYSATLLLALPSGSARSASSARCRRRAPGRRSRRPRGCRATRRRPRRRACVWPLTEPGLGGAHEDAAALLAAQHLVVGGAADPLDVDLVELEPAPAAAALAQRGRADAAAGGADLLVERHQVRADLGDDGRARRRRRRRPRASSRGERLVAGGLELVDARRQRARCPARARRRRSRAPRRAP